MSPARAIVFDFNGTLSDDEPILYAIFADLFAERGRPLTERQYYDELAGLSDPEVVRRWLGPDHPDVDAVVEQRIERYRTAVGDGSTVPERVRKQRQGETADAVAGERELHFRVRALDEVDRREAARLVHRDRGRAVPDESRAAAVPPADEH